MHTSVIRRAIIGGIGAFALIILGFMSLTTVDEGNVGIKRTNRAAVAVLEPGLHFTIPFIQDVVEMSVRSNVFKFDKLPTYSRDQQPTDLALSVQVALDPSEALELYQRFGTNVVGRTVTPVVESAVKSVFGQYNAVNTIQQRAKLGVELFEAVRDGVGVPGVRVESVNLTNVDFSDAYEKSIEQRMLAEVEVERLKQNRDRELVQNQILENNAKAQANATVSAAEAQAKSVVLRAKADAEAIALRGEAEARAIEARGRALRDNPVVVELIQAERWDGKLPVTMVPNATVPFVNIK